MNRLVAVMQSKSPYSPAMLLAGFMDGMLYGALLASGQRSRKPGAHPACAIERPSLATTARHALTIRAEADLCPVWIRETGGRALLRLRTNTPPVRCMVCTSSGFTFLPSCKRARVCVSTPLLSLKLIPLHGGSGVMRSHPARQSLRMNQHEESACENRPRRKGAPLNSALYNRTRRPPCQTYTCCSCMT